MKTKTISAFSFTSLLLSPAIAQANSITADSKAWVNDGLTVEVGASQRQYNMSGIKPVHKVREVHVPSVPAYSYHDAHGREVHVPEVLGYSYHENYTVYEKTTKSVSLLSGNAKVVGKINSNVIIGACIDNRLYATAAVKVSNLVGSGSVNSAGQYSATLAYSPFKNVALIAHSQKDFTAFGTQIQIGDTSVQVAYAPTVQGWSFGVGQEISTKQPTFQATKLEAVKTEATKEAEPEAEVEVESEAEAEATLESDKIEKLPPDGSHIRGRG
jgi:hypothetical protein